MKVAIIGGGIAGLSAADALSEHCDVTVFEKQDKIGGHADTQEIEIDGKEVSVDTGFIVFNEDMYPNFMKLLNKYSVAHEKSDMSFSVTNKISGLEYGTSTLSSVFSQLKNLVNFRFYRMFWEIKRFYSTAELSLEEDLISLGEYLKNNNYSDYFVNQHIVPMASALWSGKAEMILDFPVQYMVSFMKNHSMLQLFNRPQWRTISNGSRQYLSQIKEKINCQFVLNCDIKSVQRTDTVKLTTDKGELEFDKVIFACHSNQALELLGEQATELEQEVLGDIPYQTNSITLHTDSSVMPKGKKAWSSWNVLIDRVSEEHCTVSYYMNLLQNIESSKPIIVSLNLDEYIDESSVILKRQYEHPIYDINTIKAQKKRNLLQSQKHTFYCGAYWGWGFHEDGARSGVEAAQSLLRHAGFYEK